MRMVEGVVERRLLRGEDIERENEGGKREWDDQEELDQQKEKRRKRKGEWGRGRESEREGEWRGR